MKRTDELLQDARFSKRYQGYHYLLLCVELAAEDELRLCSLIKRCDTLYKRFTFSIMTLLYIYFVKLSTK